ncbi:hypothetical protein ACQP2T_64000 (plasmid) [Nonomuraea sp. CA-143628]|uniref:hypothetical protein n=1 Tax=Nonomuraea sp. CA-143628 TaxID=3239997 RepID=UPI003D8C8111
MSDDLRHRYREALAATNTLDLVMAVRDEELAALRRELESALDRMEADRLKHRAERDIWKECDERQWQRIRAAESEIINLTDYGLSWRERAEKAEAGNARVRELGEQWRALAPDDDWGDSMADTVMADAGRAVLAALDDTTEADRG